MNRTFKLTAAALLLAALAGCSPAAKGLLAKSYADIKAANSLLAKVALVAPCAMTHGAYTRLPKADRMAVDAIDCSTR